MSNKEPTNYSIHTLIWFFQHLAWRLSWILGNACWSFQYISNRSVRPQEGLHWFAIVLYGISIFFPNLLRSFYHQTINFPTKLEIAVRIIFLNPSILSLKPVQIVSYTLNCTESYFVWDSNSMPKFCFNLQ